MSVTTTDVVVVGAGPTGLTLAASLQRAGVRALVLERARRPRTTSRAAVVHARTLEVLEDLGVTPGLLAEGLAVPVVTVRDRRRVLARLDLSDLPTAYPFALLLSQARTEAVLAERLAELGGGVERGLEVTGVRPVAYGVSVTATGPGGDEREIRARWVVGADGMRSTVRRCAGIGFTGARYAQSFVLADVALDRAWPDTEAQLFLSPGGVLLVAPLPGARHRVVATVDRAPAQVDQAFVQGVLDERGPGGATAGEPAWGSVFSVHHRLADTYRRGPVLLVGDAAHVHSPAGGQGMNLGIQDAVALGGLLSDVVAGHAPVAALDAYERARRPSARRVVALTDRLTRGATLRRPAARAARDLLVAGVGRVPPVRRQLARRVAGLDPGRR